jgi:hypothetical protein
MKTHIVTPNSPAGAGPSAQRSARWQFRSKIEWTTLREWHPGFVRSWWIGGQIGKYANDAYTVGFRICGLFLGVWVFLPNGELSR